MSSVWQEVEVEVELLHMTGAIENQQGVSQGTPHTAYTERKTMHRKTVVGTAGGGALPSDN